ncbi:MAG: dTDP-glucose 4,6-dehydratase [Candidatus Harrisonbacteria bacterium]|nr:dTDP-glucose 4,6-dehydratase [Candidatus Harrisonbacteria bacterium]
MKLLVTGGAGFIGSNFIHYWMKHHPEDKIVNLDKLTYAGHLENLESVAKHPNYTFVHGDICDPVTVRKAMKGADTVVHFAAESHVDRSIADAAPFVVTNVLGTQVLLQAALTAKVARFHHVSTDEVFGSLALEDKRKFDERSPYRPSSPYAASKAASDHLARAYAHTYGLPLTISNCSNNYGPYQTPEKLIPLMITYALQEKPLPVYGKGVNVRDWVHVLDHCRGIEAVLLRGKVGETYCIGGGAERANIDVVKTILRNLGKDVSLITYVDDRLGHDLRYAIDYTKAAKELGYAPQYDFDDGLKETVGWYIKNKRWVEKVGQKLDGPTKVRNSTKIRKDKDYESTK